MEDIFNPEFIRIIEETQELAIKAATASLKEFKGFISINLETSGYYRHKVEMKIDHIRNLMRSFLFRTDIYFLMKLQKDFLQLLSVVLSEINSQKKYQGLKIFHEFLEKTKMDTNYTYWKRHSIISTSIETFDG
jgi:hypothetical protein